MKKADLKKMEAEAQAMERGEVTPARVWEVKKLPNGKIVRKQLDPEAYRRKQASNWKAKTEAAKVRRLVNVTQEDFASLLGVSLGTVRKWESGEIEPSGAARTLLKIAAKHPEIVREATAG